MDQVCSSAGSTEAVFASPTTAPPPSERATSAATPARIRPNPHALSASRRQPRARYMPRAIRPSHRITRMIASTFRRFTPSCASSSSSECRITSCAASAGSFSASRPPTPNCAWVCSSSPFRSSVTSPPVVDTLSAPPSSTTWRKRLWARRFACSHSSCAPGRSSSLSTPALRDPGTPRRPGRPAARAAAATCLRARPVRRRSHRAVDQVDRQLAPDLVVLEQLGARMVQLSVSSSCRFAQMAKMASSARTEPTVISVSGSARRRLGPSEAIRLPKPDRPPGAMAHAGVMGERWASPRG